MSRSRKLDLAVKLAEKDVEFAIGLAEDRMEPSGVLEGRYQDLIENGRSLIVDGSLWSPSWRALDGGAEVWSRATNVNLSLEIPAYEETLDAAVSAWNVEQSQREFAEGEAPVTYSLSWEDGCLFLYAHDHEEASS